MASASLQPATVRGGKITVRMLLKSTNIVLAGLLGVVAVGLAFVALPWFGNKALIVRSGSMEPTIRVGDLVVVNSKDEGLLSPLPLVSHKYKEGDVIAFKSGKNGKILTTHRIVGSEIKDEKLFYLTKGDANNAADDGLVAEENIIGKTILIFPYVGRLFAFTKSNVGFPLLVIFPALLVIIFESINIFKEASHLRGGRRDSSEVSANNNGIVMRILLPLIISVLFIQNSHAFFSDTATSSNNTFAAAESFGPPIANHLVINEVYYDPDADHIQGGGPDPNERDFEWIELYNPTSSTVNLKNWKIQDNSVTERTISTSNRDLTPGQFAVLAKAANVFTLWSIPSSADKIPLGERFGNGLANTDDRVILKDNNGNVVDQMSYGVGDTTAFNPSAPDVAEGHSLEREPDGVDTDTKNDFVDRETPTPGS